MVVPKRISLHFLIILKNMFFLWLPIQFPLPHSDQLKKENIIPNAIIVHPNVRVVLNFRIGKKINPL